MSDTTLIRHRFVAFGGAQCEILSYRGAEADVSSAVAEVYVFEAQLTRFVSDSELCRFNACAGRWVPVSPLLRSVLQASLDAWEISDGLVNAAVGGALVAAGYDRTISMVRQQPGPRRPSAPIPPLPSVLELSSTEACLEPGYAMDLGGVGKGWLADQLCLRLENAVVNLGGDLRVMGGGPGGEGWSLQLCDGSRHLVKDAGVATSGTVGRCWSGGHHLIDPRTGTPAVTDIAAVSVAAASTVAAEALAKGAAIMGAEQAPDWLRGKGAAAWAVLTEAAQLIS